MAGDFMFLFRFFLRVFMTNLLILSSSLTTKKSLLYNYSVLNFKIKKKKKTENFLFCLYSFFSRCFVCLFYLKKKEKKFNVIYIFIDDPFLISNLKNKILSLYGFLIYFGVISVFWRILTIFYLDYISHLSVYLQLIIYR